MARTIFFFMNIRKYSTDSDKNITDLYSALGHKRCGGSEWAGFAPAEGCFAKAFSDGASPVPTVPRITDRANQIQLRPYAGSDGPAAEICDFGKPHAVGVRRCAASPRPRGQMGAANKNTAAS